MQYWPPFDRADVMTAMVKVGSHFELKGRVKGEEVPKAPFTPHLSPCIQNQCQSEE